MFFQSRALYEGYYEVDFNTFNEDFHIIWLQPNCKSMTFVLRKWKFRQVTSPEL